MRATVECVVVSSLVLFSAPSMLGPAQAGTPPASCTSSTTHCNLSTDLLIFNDGSSTYRIVAHITDCESCGVPDANDNFSFLGSAQVTFGPYATGHSCVPGSDTLPLDIKSRIRPNRTPFPDHYVPSDSSEEFVPTQTVPLKTRCVDPANLDYRIPKVILTGRNGAKTDTRASGLNSLLRLPNSVRSSEGRNVGLDTHRLTQGLTFAYTDQRDSASTLRYWPDGMPFRIGPYTIDYVPAEVSFTTSSPPTGPTPYEIVPPDGSSLDPGQIINCTDPQNPPNPWGCHVWNAGIFDGTWYPSGTRFNASGMDLDLAKSSMGSIRFQPLFPRGTWLELNGPASLRIEDSRLIEGGTFDSGTAWLQIQRHGPCQDDSQIVGFLLNGAPDQPRITRDGGIVAGVRDLNQPIGWDPVTIDWTVNKVAFAGGGTFWMPPAFNPFHRAGTTILTGPQTEWLRSATAEDLPGLLSDPSADGRGIYAGFNYNRNRVCEGGTNDGKLCGDGTHCPGGTCAHDRWSPLCPPQDLLYPPTWTVEFQKPDPAPPGYVAPVFEIPPTDPAKEMAFYMRQSGVTGVFDAGPVDFTLGGNDPAEFDLTFNAFGHAFLASHSEFSDTIIRGGLHLDWPSNTIIPFNDMTMCDCGSAKSATTGEPPVENMLGYWSARFYPHDVRFSPDPPGAVNCGDPASTACSGSAGTPQSVCIDASTPIPHFTPDADASWSMGPEGLPGEIVPLKDPVYQFESALDDEPFSYHVENYQLSTWPGPAAASQGDVESGLVPYGFYEGAGQLAMPYFGLPDAGIRVRRSTPQQLVYGVDLHEKGNMQDPVPFGDSHIFVERKIAADTVPLSYKLDYFQPEETADLEDGDNNVGRGPLLGFSWKEDSTDPAAANLDLGSIEVPAALVITPQSIVSDIGPAASMRLWGATQAEGRSHLDEVVPAGRLAGWPHDEALARLPYDPWALPGQANYVSFIEEQHATGLLELYRGHPDFARRYRTSSHPTDPGMNASPIAGFLAFSSDRQQVDLAYVDANVDTNGEFFAFDRSLLKVDRHIKSNSPDQPIAQLERKNQPGNMALPGKMSIPFPDVPGMQWDFEYNFNPLPTFVSLTGSLDLTQGGLSGIGFDKAGMTLKYWADGDWYFEAGLKLNFNGYGAYGDILLGNTKDMTPLRALDPTVADFLSGISTFNGGYARVGVQGRIFDYGCLFRVSAGIEVGGWYISGCGGGKLRGWVSGKGACIVSVRGDVTLLGGEVGDKFKMQGNMWVAGGLGFCDEESWDTPADVFDDDFCAACVLSGSITGITPPKFKLSMDGPDVECSLF